jgi:hypothetical protein
VFEDIVLRRITEDSRKLDNEELHSSYFSPWSKKKVKNR